MNTSGKIIDELAERFMGTPLPESVRSDLCATMPPSKGYQRIGTNLLTFDEAKQMLSSVLEGFILARACNPDHKCEFASILRPDKDGRYRCKHCDKVLMSENPDGKTCDHVGIPIPDQNGCVRCLKCGSVLFTVALPAPGHSILSAARHIDAMESRMDAMRKEIADLREENMVLWKRVGHLIQLSEMKEKP